MANRSRPRRRRPCFPSRRRLRRRRRLPSPPRMRSSSRSTRPRMSPPTARVTRPKSEHTDAVSVDPRTSLRALESTSPVAASKTKREHLRATSLVRQRGTRASGCLCTSEPARALVRPCVSVVRGGGAASFSNSGTPADSPGPFCERPCADDVWMPWSMDVVRVCVVSLVERAHAFRSAVVTFRLCWCVWRPAAACAMKDRNRSASIFLATRSPGTGGTSQTTSRQHRPGHRAP